MLCVCVCALSPLLSAQEALTLRVGGVAGWVAVGMATAAYVREHGWAEGVRRGASSVRLALHWGGQLLIAAAGRDRAAFWARWRLGRAALDLASSWLRELLLTCGALAVLVRRLRCEDGGAGTRPPRARAGLHSRSLSRLFARGRRRRGAFVSGTDWRRTRERWRCPCSCFWVGWACWQRLRQAVTRRCGGCRGRRSASRTRRACCWHPPGCAGGRTRRRVTLWSTHCSWWRCRCSRGRRLCSWRPRGVASSSSARTHTRASSEHTV